MKNTEQNSKDLEKTISTLAWANSILFQDDRVVFTYHGDVHYANTIFHNPTVIIYNEQLNQIHKDFAPGSEGAIAEARNSVEVIK